MKSLGYARVSSREQAENSHALGQQIERLKAAGATEIYSDVESGSKDDRSAFNQLMETVKAGVIDEVVITRLDRLSRSLITLRKTLEVIRCTEVNLRVLDDNIDLSTAAGKFHINLLGALAEMEVDQLSERVRHGHQHHRDRNAAYFAPFGYVKVEDDLELDHTPFLCLLADQVEMSRAAIGRDMVETFMACRSLRRSLRTINQKYGITSHAYKGKGNKQARGKFHFHTSGFTSWLNNPILRGHLCYGRSRRQRQSHKHLWDIRYDTHPDHRLINEEEYRQIEAILDYNSKQGGFSFKSDIIHPLSGLIYCEQCNRKCRITHFRLRSDPSVKKYSYQCNSYHLNACTQKRSVREPILEQAIIDALMTRAEEIAEIAQLPQEAVDPPALQALKAELAYYEAAPGNRADAIIADLKKQIGAFWHRQLLEDKHQLANQELLQGFSDRRYWQTLLPEEKQDLYRALVDRVYMREGKVAGVELKV
ncbi:MAG: fdxN element excision recombinase XisF [Leptolyngbyaceae cyanobacterium MO_188.B28]|nr:fdxN element excision recombinase XisF [Leptolyngbyaceae cyanobacterium MO_188.B28]